MGAAEWGLALIRRKHLLEVGACSGLSVNGMALIRVALVRDTALIRGNRVYVAYFVHVAFFFNMHLTYQS